MQDIQYSEGVLDEDYLSLNTLSNSSNKVRNNLKYLGFPIDIIQINLNPYFIRLKVLGENSMLPQKSLHCLILGIFLALCLWKRGCLFNVTPCRMVWVLMCFPSPNTKLECPNLSKTWHLTQHSFSS